MVEDKPAVEEGPSWDALHEVANGQSGYFTAHQAAEAGFSAQLLYKHVHSGNLSRPARAVYRITRFPPGEYEDLVVLWLWSGQEAVFSHETALQLHDLSEALPSRIHLTLPRASKGRSIPEGATVAFADLANTDRQWLGPIPVTTPRRTVLDVAAAHGDAAIIAQTIDQGILRGLFRAAEIAPAAAYVAAAQGLGTGAAGLLEGGGVGTGLGDGYGIGLPDGSGYGTDDPVAAFGDDLWARPFSGTCAEPPPSDWPSVAAEVGVRHGALLRGARYLPSRSMVVEFAWPVGKIPTEPGVKKLRKQLATRFSWV